MTACDLCGEEIVVPEGHGLGVCCFQDVMIDLETLGVGPNAAIVQIGAVRFDSFARGTGLISAPEHTFSWNVQLTGDAALDGDIEHGTVFWWMRQSDSARKRVFSPDVEPQGHIGHAVDHLRGWLEALPFRRVWANSPSFDLALLKQAYSRWQGDVVNWPIKHHQERDFRTLRKEVGEFIGVPEPVRVGVEHDALDDAFHQAGYVIQIMRAMKERLG